MRNIIEKLKNLNAVDKFLLLATCILVFLLTANFVVNIKHLNEFNDRQNQGNDRWKQVENRIHEYEIKIDTLEEIITKRGG